MVMAVVCDGSKWEQILSAKEQETGSRQQKATEDELIKARELNVKLFSVARKQLQMSNDETDLSLLAAALRRLQSLPMLQIEGAVYDGTTGYRAASKMQKWQIVFLRASQVYRTVMLAIARSGVAIGKLHIYKTSRRCSVPIWEIDGLMPMLNGRNSINAGKGIKTLSLSCSTDFEGLSYEQVNHVGVARLLQQLPHLETLELHLYNTYHRSDNTYHRSDEGDYAKILTHIAQMVRLPALRHVSLGGVSCKQCDLIGFLKAHQTPLQTLSLRQITLVDRGWPRIFEQLCTMPNLQNVKLDTLYGTDNGKTLHLGPKSRPSRRGGLRNAQDESYWEGLESGSQCVPCLDGTLMFARKFTRDEFLRERFQFAKGPQQRTMGSAAAYRRHQNRRREFGPP
ncbi:MAG: hypothetical protein Q9174_004745 [Haloplaca sp. 1 TL-2023]